MDGLGGRCPTSDRAPTFPRSVPWLAGDVPLSAPEARGSRAVSSELGRSIRSRPSPTCSRHLGCWPSGGHRKPTVTPSKRSPLRRMTRRRCSARAWRTSPWAGSRRASQAAERGVSVSHRGPTSRGCWGGHSPAEDVRTRPACSSRSCECGRRPRLKSCPRAGCSARSGRSTQPSRCSRGPRTSTSFGSTTPGCPASIPSAPTRDSTRCSNASVCRRRHPKRLTSIRKP